MKIVSNKVSSLLAMLFTCAFGYAGGEPPQPTPPVPPGLSVDGGIMIMVMLSTIYGLYKLHQFNINKKTPV